MANPLGIFNSGLLIGEWASDPQVIQGWFSYELINGSSTISASIAVTDGADVLLANTAPLIGLLSATTDGSDSLAANVSPLVAGISATTDGADLLAASVAPIVGLSSAITDGADVASGALNPIVALSVAVTDGQDVLSGNASAIVGLSIGTTDGADVLVGNLNLVSGSIDASVAAFDGADTLSSSVDSGTLATGAADYDEPKKKKYVVRVGDKLFVFKNKADALNALPDDKPVKLYPLKKGQKPKPEAAPVAKPEYSLSIAAINQSAAIYQEQEHVASLLRQKQYEALIAFYRDLQEREEDDIELLLMAA